MYTTTYKKIFRTYKKFFKTYTETLVQVKCNFNTHKIAMCLQGSTKKLLSIFNYYL